MNREEKKVIIDSLAEKLKEYSHFYITDTSELNAEQTAALRKMCFEQQGKLVVVKNTLFIKALEQVEKAEAELMPTLKGETAVMFCNTGKGPAKLIKEFRKANPKPVLKAAYVEQCVYLGEAPSRNWSTSSPARSLSAISSLCCSLLPRTSSRLCRDLPDRKSQGWSKPSRQGLSVPPDRIGPTARPEREGRVA